MTARKSTARPVPVAVVSVVEMAALRKFAATHGRTWKAALLERRLRGAPLDPTLVQIVNRLGPTTVRRLKLTAAPKANARHRRPAARR